MSSTGGTTYTIYSDAAGTTPANPQDVYNAFMSGLVLLAPIGSDVATYKIGSDVPTGGVAIALGMQYYGTPPAVTKVVLKTASGDAVARE